MKEKIDVIKELEESVIEDKERIENLSSEKDRFLATKGMNEKVETVTNAKKAKAEGASNIMRGIGAVLTGAAAIGALIVEIIKNKNSNDRKNKILDNEIEIMDRFKREAYQDRD